MSAPNLACVEVARLVRLDRLARLVRLVRLGRPVTEKNCKTHYSRER